MLRLDSYPPALLQRGAHLISRYMVPVLQRAAISGKALVNIGADELDDPMLLSVIVDVLADRGFAACVERVVEHRPESVVAATGRILCSQVRCASEYGCWCALVGNAQAVDVDCAVSLVRWRGHGSRKLH